MREASAHPGGGDTLPPDIAPLPADGAATVFARRRMRWWPRGAWIAGSLFVAGVGLLASTALHGLPSSHASPSGGDTGPAPEFRLANDPGTTTADGEPGNSVAQAAFQGAPESRLIAIYRTIAAGQTDAATEAAAALVRDVPSFRLAQLVYADLLSARIGHSPRIGNSASEAGTGPAGRSAAELSQLRDEALLRLKALRERPPAGMIPAEFILLPKSVHHAIAVDTSRARLYLFENTSQGMRLVSDHYVSVGKQGVNKAVEGDQRTPLGVYFVSDRIAQSALESRFGAGALQLNYPNAYDRLQGRTGSGIYLHGVPASTYSRPPQDSDGCVVMANDELLPLMASIPLHDTPVVLARQIHWVKEDSTKAERAEILRQVERWQKARAADDMQALVAFYGPGATPTPLAALPSSRSAVLRRSISTNGNAAFPDAVAFDELSVLGWSDDDQTMVVTFHERFPALRRDTVLRQYWARADKGWRIVAEGTVR